MRTVQELAEMAIEYIGKYFEGDIESDIRINQDKRIKSYARCNAPVNGVCTIDVNPKLLRLDDRIIKNTLVHELIHLWQFEGGYSHEENGMHGETFNQWCKYLKNKTGINIQQYGSEFENNAMKRENSAYFIYDPQDGWGYFTKSVYDFEINKLKSKGFNVYFIEKPTMTWYKDSSGNSRKKNFILSPLKFDLDDLPGNQCYKLNHFNSKSLQEV